jgi:hypothetical protein
MERISIDDGRFSIWHAVHAATDRPVALTTGDHTYGILMSAGAYAKVQEQIRQVEARLRSIKGVIDLLQYTYINLEQESGALLTALPPMPPNPQADHEGPEAEPDTPEEASPSVPDPLTVHNLSAQEGRYAFLSSLHYEYQHEGLLMATNHVWASMNRPKAARCEAMASKLGISGKGKSALRKLLACFLDETEVLLGATPDIPPLDAFPDMDAWFKQCHDIFGEMDLIVSQQVMKFEAILDGRDPPSGPVQQNVGQVIAGPWLEKLRRGLPGRKGDPG